MKTAAEEVQDILSKFDLNNYVDSCKGLTLAEFEQYTIKLIDEFESEILSFKLEDEEGLSTFVNGFSKIRVFYGKALNYTRTKQVALKLKDGEQELLNKLYQGIIGCAS